MRVPSPPVPEHGHRDAPELRQARSPRGVPRHTGARDRPQLRLSSRSRGGWEVHAGRERWELYYVC